MTLVAAWTRRMKNSTELVIASDSRLRWGRAWDCCPKIFPLARRDSALCFTGDTMYAYPMIVQVQQQIQMHDSVLSRAYDVTQIRSTIIDIVNKMFLNIHDKPKAEKHEEEPDVFLLLAGFSWRHSRFFIWKLSHSKKKHEFVFSSPKGGNNPNKQQYMFCGDHVRTARNRLRILLQRRGKRSTSKHLDMEPFEVLRDMIRDENLSEIGGPPQLIKIYRHMNFLPINVFWPSKSEGRITYLGRELLDYEKNKYLTLDPDTLKIEPFAFSSSESVDSSCS